MAGNDSIASIAVVALFLLLCCPKPSLEVDNLRKRMNVNDNAPAAVRKHESISHVPQKFINELEEKAYYALKYIHHQMDDDHSGNVDLQESDEFIREELDNANGQIRQEKFHQNDFQISVQEMWFSFKKSPLYNWTVDDVILWLNDHVDLPQYAPAFRAKGISGLHLPLLAANQDHYFTKTVGRFPADAKRKIILKATDAVLFGPPTRSNGHSFLKDLFLLLAIVVASTCAWMADNRSKRSKRDLSAMHTKMETLAKTESDLRELQEQLKAEEKLTVQLELSIKEDAKKKESLMEEISREKAVADKFKSLRLNTEEKEERLRYAEEELEQVRVALHHVERELSLAEAEDGSAFFLSVVSKELHRLLRKTYQRETNSYQSQKLAAEKRLTEAKEYCVKVRKKRDSVFTMMTMPHGGLIDTVDERIGDARHALEELGENLRERRRRWHRIEAICGASFRADGDRRVVEGLEVIDEAEATKSRRSSLASSSHLFHHHLNPTSSSKASSSSSSQKRRSIASANDSSSGDDGSPRGRGSPPSSSSRAVSPVTFFLNSEMVSNSSACDLSSSSLSLPSCAAAPRRPSDLLFRRSSTLPKGHSRFDAAASKTTTTTTPPSEGFLRTNSEAALSSPADGSDDDDDDASKSGKQEEEERSAASANEAASLTATSGTTENNNDDDRKSSSPIATSSSEGSPTKAKTQRRRSDDPTAQQSHQSQQSTKMKKAKKLLSKFLSREKLSETTQNDL